MIPKLHIILEFCQRNVSIIDAVHYLVNYLTIRFWMANFDVFIKEAMQRYYYEHYFLHILDHHP